MIERFGVLRPFGPVLVFFARRSWRERWRAFDDVLDDPGLDHNWTLWLMATLLGIPASIVVILFEPGGTVRYGGIVLLLVCLLIFWGGCKALDQRANARIADDLVAKRRREPGPRDA